MIITYFRSSSFNNWRFCEMQYYLTYVCGYSYSPGKKADKGTITHKVLEVLAGIKKQIQDNPNSNCYEDKAIGDVYFDKDKLLEPYYLDSEEVEAINKGRINKQTYKSPCSIEEGHVRYGVQLVEEVFERSYEYYIKRSFDKWYPADKRDCLNWVWMALDYKGGIFDPRRRNVFAPELKFDLTIDDDWARYDYMLEGKQISGQLAIKGTIDLLTLVNEDTIEVVDWKTGQRIDWANGGEKTYEKLCKDPQLMMYFYAIKRLFPHIKNVIMTIFFIRDGGPFSICFSSADMEKVEEMLKKRYYEIQDSIKPKLQDPKQRDFKCTKLCPFYKHKFVSKDPLNMCRRAERTIEEVGIDEATLELMNPGHEVGNYEDPG